MLDFFFSWNVVDEICGARILEIGAGTGSLITPHRSSSQPAVNLKGKENSFSLKIALRFGGAISGCSRREFGHYDGPGVRHALMNIY